MKKVFGFLIISLLSVSGLFGWYASNEQTQAAQTAAAQASETAVAQATTMAAEAAVAAMPIPGLKLYLDHEDKLLRNIDSSTTSTYYLYGEQKLLEWSYRLGDETLKDSYAYNLVMASAGKSSVSIKIILKQGQQEKILGQDKFVMNSTLYRPYLGQIPGTDVTTKPGDQVILRMTVSGDDFGIIHDQVSSSISILESSPLPPAIAEERTKALVWVATNNAWGIESDIFTSFRDELDQVISTDSNVQWHFGWDLTTSGKPYSLEWSDGIFNVEDISMEEAEQLELGKDSVTLSLLP